MEPWFNIHNPVLEHSELLRPGEDRPEARSISLSVSATELIANLKAGEKAILQSNGPRFIEPQIIAHKIVNRIGPLLSAVQFDLRSCVLLSAVR